MATANDLGISPPPWHYDDAKDEFMGICAVWDANNVFLVGTGDMEDADYSEIANARLMAAAPELYEALEMLCNGLEWNIENHPTVMNESDREALALARAALAKARGEGGQP
jgi:hypothetical protein